MRGLKRLRAALGKMCRVFPINKKKCVFICFGGQSYADNPRAVSESLRELRPDAKIVWLFSDPRGKALAAPKYIKRARIHAPMAIYHLATAATWVINTLAPDYMDKRPGQMYIQTWHGDRGFKVCLHKSGEHGLRDANMIDVCVSGSDHCDRFYKSAFQYQGEILRAGSPRNDVLLNPDETRNEETKKKLGLTSARVLLYAPTMRDSRAKLKVDIDFSSILDALKKRDGVEWTALVRAHFMNRALYGLEDDSRIKDVSAYEDMADLLSIADILVTDYSSSAGDFVLTGRPVVLYQRKDEEFTKGNRDLYFDVKDSHFAVAETAGELMEKILTSNAGSEKTDREVLDFFGADESGRAGAEVARVISQHMDGRGKH